MTDTDITTEYEFMIPKWTDRYTLMWWYHSKMPNDSYHLWLSDEHKKLLIGILEGDSSDTIPHNLEVTYPSFTGDIRVKATDVVVTKK